MPRFRRALGPAAAHMTAAAGPGQSGTCWPTAEEELLLTAAFRPRDEALAAWGRWQATVDLVMADARTHTLLPLVYRRLLAHGVPAASLGRLRGMYRREWYENQLLLDRAGRLLAAFAEAGIGTLVLKGAPLVVRYYRDAGVRPMRDIDILIPLDQARAAIGVLEGLGWRSTWPLLDGYLATRHALPFKDEAGHEVDLHWRVLWECWFPGADDGFWQAAVPISIGGTETLTLGVADQLVHACAHGVSWNQVSPVRWVADALMILGDGLTAADWAWVVRQAQALGMVLPVLAGLRYLCDRWDAPVPDDVLRALERLPVPRVQRLVHDARISPPRRVLGYAPLVAYRYFLPDRGVSLRDVGGFLRYFQQYIGLEHVGQLPAFIAVWIGERLARRWRERTHRIGRPRGPERSAAPV